MKPAGVRVAKNVGWAIGKTLNIVGAIGRKIAIEVTNRPKHNIQVINSHTGEIMHEANNVSTNELNKILDAMRVLKGTVETIVKTVK